MGWLDFFRSLRGDRPAESARLLAFETTLQAAELAGEGGPPGLEQMSTPSMLHAARGLLVTVNERQRADTQRAEALRVELARLRAENAALRRRLPAPGPEADEEEPAEVEPPPIVHTLIDISDRVAGLRDSVEPAVTRWLLDRITEALADAGVSAIREEGAVDTTRHAVLGVRATADPELVDRIAETVRPGYRWNDQVLRPQQVIAYVEDGR
ncbi:hypothetical protein [Actinomadura sp. HBU206391]|uniref:hypothetical protein n=1 Tax=Actinomadura sp. HBU206391 TaxID=2731692 RepID=UPI00165022FE|nr:hypothetical protein [Actinomadura sp. HBU206391]MBC6457024.1 hypothetical protein [Actinomadura sp. HBU206391]